MKLCIMDYIHNVLSPMNRLTHGLTLISVLAGYLYIYIFILLISTIYSHFGNVKLWALTSELWEIYKLVVNIYTYKTDNDNQSFITTTC